MFYSVVGLWMTGGRFKFLGEIFDTNYSPMQISKYAGILCGMDQLSRNKVVALVDVNVKNVMTLVRFFQCSIKAVRRGLMDSVFGNGPIIAIARDSSKKRMETDVVNSDEALLYPELRQNCSALPLYKRHWPCAAISTRITAFYQVVSWTDDRRGQKEWQIHYGCAQWSEEKIMYCAICLWLSCQSFVTGWIEVYRIFLHLPLTMFLILGKLQLENVSLWCWGKYTLLYFTPTKRNNLKVFHWWTAHRNKPQRFIEAPNGTEGWVQLWLDFTDISWPQSTKIIQSWFVTLSKMLVIMNTISALKRITISPLEHVVVDQIWFWVYVSDGFLHSIKTTFFHDMTCMQKANLTHTAYKWDQLKTVLAPI